jgi:hypothetical protein
MNRKSTKVVRGLLVVASLGLGIALTAAAQRDPRQEVRLFGPIGGTGGQTLRITVAALPTEDGLTFGDNVVSIEVADAFGTDLEPLAELQATVQPGRGVVLDHEFRPEGDAPERQEVVIRVAVQQREERGRKGPGPVLVSVQVSETASGVNQLWGDWFIIDAGR